MRIKPKPLTIKSVILLIGTELTKGLVQDRHLSFLGQELAAIGIDVVKALQVPDDLDLIISELELAQNQCPVIIISGGLGPTEDDITREAVSALVKKPLIFHQEIFDRIKARFRGLEIAESNRKQAECPEGFEFLPNPHGSAPGFYGESGHSLIFSLPGPPSELRPMFLEHVRPILKQTFSVEVQEELFFNSFMVSESLLQDVFTAEKKSGISLSTRLEDDRIVGTLRGKNRDDLLATLDALKRRFGLMRIQENNEFLGARVLDSLRKANMRLVLAESCTGGLISQWITQVSGSSDVFWGAVVSYDNEAKMKLLEVDDDTLTQRGAVSKETALAMVRGAQKCSKADAAIAVTGIAGPSGGTKEKPVGTVWIAVKLGEKLRVERFSFKGSRDRIRLKAGVTGLLLCQAMALDWEIADLSSFL